MRVGVRKNTLNLFFVFCLNLCYAESSKRRAVLKFSFICVASIAMLASCAPEITPANGDNDPNAVPTRHDYTESSVSGLIAIRPYPSPADVCQEITDIAPYAEEGYFLIACPKHETGAIAVRKNEGAVVVAYAEHWTILKVTDL